MWSVGLGCTSVNDNDAKYDYGNLNGFVSPQEVIKSLVISMFEYADVF